MDGFGDAVDGYYDVEDLLARYLRTRAEDHFADQRVEKQRIDSRSEFEARRERVRDDFLAAVGGLPDRPSDLAVEVTDRHVRDGYAVDVLAFESLPDFHVTANCYVPDGGGPHPGVLFLCGHVDDPKGDTFNQQACIELALNGFVVLVFDPICQGERAQYFDAETGEPRSSSAMSTSTIGVLAGDVQGRSATSERDEFRRFDRPVESWEGRPRHPFP